MTILPSLTAHPLPLARSAVALGMFDGVHLGHQAVLKAAVDAAAEYALTPCAFTFALTKPRPNFKKSHILTDAKTLARLLAGQGIEYALAPPFLDMRDFAPKEFVQKVLLNTLGAKVVCCGENFTFAKGGLAGTAHLLRIGAEMGIAVKVLPLLRLDSQRVSSSRIRSLIEDGNMPGAARLLGRSFAIDLPVVEGNRIGHTLGTPTINQPFPAYFTVPRYGVYATIAEVDGTRYAGVTNVGVKPTVGSDMPLAETYIQGFSGDLYGRDITVTFLEFIRPERRFASLEELRTHIWQDARAAKTVVEKYVDLS